MWWDVSAVYGYKGVCDGISAIYEYKEVCDGMLAIGTDISYIYEKKNIFLEAIFFTN